MAGRPPRHDRPGRRDDGLIALVTFGRPATANDGGTARLYAVSDYVERVLGGEVVDLAAVAPGRPVAVRALVAALVFVRTVLRTRARYVLLEYPGFPALGVYYRSPRPSWLARAGCAVAYARAHAALRFVRAVCRLRGRRLVVGVGDVPSQELHLPDRNRPASARLTERFERALLGAADAVWVVTPEERDLLARLYDVPPERFVIVPNGNHRVPPPPPRTPGGPVRIVYAGSLYRDRESLTEAVGLALRLAAEITVTFAGPGGEWVETTFADSRVRWLGTLSERACFDLVAASDIGLLVYFADEPYYEIVHPTKLSLYLAGAVPILSGDARYLARFVTEHGIGLAVPRAEFATALLGLIEDEPARRRMSAAAEAIREDFFWDAIYDRTIAATRAIAPA